VPTDKLGVRVTIWGEMSRRYREEGERERERKK